MTPYMNIKYEQQQINSKHKLTCTYYTVLIKFTPGRVRLKALSKKKIQ